LISTAIIDEHRLSRDLLHHSLVRDGRLDVVAVATTATEVPRYQDGPEVGLIVIAAFGPGPDLPAEIATSLDRQPNARVAVLTLTDDGHLADALGPSGATVLTAHSPLGDLIDHLAAGRPLTPVDTNDLLRTRAEIYGLTEREREVLGHLADGVTPQQIARRLGVALHTVRDHIGALRRKLDCATATQVVIAAHRLGLAPHVSRPLR
jgi:DNA-binding NarL/FixJ family response regulator